MKAPRAGWIVLAAGLLVCSFASLAGVSVRALVVNGTVAALAAAGGALVTTRSSPLHRRDGATDEREVVQVRSELAALREENARLRLQAQRAAGVSQVVARVRGIATEGAGAPGSELDDPVKAYTEARVMRTALVVACRDLQTALAHTERSLVTTIPSPELDRRIERRRPEPAGGGPGTQSQTLEDPGSRTAPDATMPRTETVMTPIIDLATWNDGQQGEALAPPERDFEPLPGARCLDQVPAR